MRVQLRLTYEMNRQLQADSNLSLPDYDVLNALRYSPGGTRDADHRLAARIAGSGAGSRTTSGAYEPRARDCRPAPDRSASDRDNAHRSGLDEITRRRSGHVDSCDGCSSTVCLTS